MKHVLLLSGISLVLLLGCQVSQETLAEHQEIRSHLKEYENDTFFQENFNDTVLTDYIDLNYQTYRKKYNLSRQEMELVAQSTKVTVSILKTYRTIEKLDRYRDTIQSIGRIDTNFFTIEHYQKIKASTDSISRLLKKDSVKREE